MPRIAGVDVPGNKRLEIAMTYVYGIGLTLSRKVLSQLELDPNMRADKLSDDEVNRLNGLLSDQYRIEGELRRDVAQNIARLRTIRCYRGMRHIRGLPCRGQQTQTNARTRKGKRKTVANKKG